jgi:hypothetical protein
MSEINLDTLQAFIDSGRIDNSKQITPRELIQSGIIGHGVKDGIKLLARGSLRSPVDIIVSRASASAIAAVEAAGGRIVTRYFTKDSMRRLALGTSIISEKPLPVGKEHVERVVDEWKAQGRKYRLPDPTSRWDIEYYRDPAHRGYLSDSLKDGESPSLYWKVPGDEKAVSLKDEKKKKEEEADVLFTRV